MDNINNYKIKIFIKRIIIFNHLLYNNKIKIKNIETFDKELFDLINFFNFDYIDNKKDFQQLFLYTNEINNCNICNNIYFDNINNTYIYK